MKNVGSPIFRDTYKTVYYQIIPMRQDGSRGKQHDTALLMKTFTERGWHSR
ncbi:hypothetical protein SESBI_43059 [Sesbania bispinosa]|nr:hypothetical protein SESBI_43059 [Sesbania bispinosa]